jgi:flagellar biosynthesis chaperone FliJ
MTVEEINDNIERCHKKIEEYNAQLQKAMESGSSVEDYNVIISELDQTIDELTSLINSI